MDIKVINTYVITATDEFKGEIGIQKGKIMEIARKVSGKGTATEGRL